MGNAELVRADFAALIETAQQSEDGKMAVRGKSNQEIADYLHISVNTVKSHLSGIYQKVKVSNRKDLENYLNK